MQVVAGGNTGVPHEPQELSCSHNLAWAHWAASALHVGIDRQHFLVTNEVFDVDILPVAATVFRLDNNSIGYRKNWGAITGNKVESAVVARAIPTGRNPVAKTRTDWDSGGKRPPNRATPRGGVGEVSTSIPRLEHLGKGGYAPRFALHANLPRGGAGDRERLSAGIFPSHASLASHSRR